jgi:hypothetical protein
MGTRRVELEKALDEAGIPRPTPEDIAAAVAPREAVVRQADVPSGL